MITETRVDTADAVRLLAQVVEREGTQTTRACRYVALRDDVLQPWCIVGCVLGELGVPANTLGRMRNDDIITVWHTHKDGLLSTLDFTLAALEVLSFAQENQDRGMNWGQVMQLVHEFLTVRERARARREAVQV